MFESGEPFFLRKTAIMMAVAGCLITTGLRLGVGRLTLAGRSPESDCGSYGSDLKFLRRSHTGPRQPGESNHYIDLWSPRALPVLTRVNADRSE